MSHFVPLPRHVGQAYGKALERTRGQARHNGEGHMMKQKNMEEYLDVGCCPSFSARLKRANFATLALDSYNTCTQKFALSIFHLIMHDPTISPSTSMM